MSFTNAEFFDLVSGRRRGVRPTLTRGLLRLASWPYGWAVGARNRLYDWGWREIHEVGVPVVSVGNLTVGGTGKTPCVEYVADFYRGLGLRVALLSRGYGSAGGRNDEAMLLEENLPDVPHLQDRDRVALARIAVDELESEVLVLDDGFQHRRLARNLDIVLIDATNPWGYGHQLPRGLLRESPRSLRRADVVVLTRSDQVSPENLARVRDRVAKLAPQATVAESVHRPHGLIGEGRIGDLTELRGRPVAAFCGIGNPDSFRATLRALGAEVVAFRAFPDHHAYDRADVESLQEWAARFAGGVVATTQKDLVKLRLARIGGRDLWAVRVGLEVTAGGDELRQRLRAVAT